MIKSLKYYFDVGVYSAKLKIQQQMEYPSFLFGWFIANPLQFVLGLLSIKIVISNFGSLGGWGYEQIAFLYGLSVVSHGLSVILFIQTWYLPWLIIYGEFDRMLVRPMNIFFQYAIMDFNLIGVTDMVPGICILIYGCAAINFEATFFNIVKILFIIAGATLIRGAMFLATSSIAFWTKSNSALVEVNLRLFDYTSMYPMTIYPRVIQMLFTYVLPLGFISFYPAAEFIGKDTGFNLPDNLWIGTFLVGMAMFTIAYLIFKKGLRRYEGAGT